nr:EOG090X0L97 [Eulimnadia texana]
MAASTSDKKTPAPKTGKNGGEEIVQGFHKLRNEQRHLVSKLSEIEMDLNEHRLVIETLKDVDGDRKCFRMVGGILVERTVKEVLPALVLNQEQLSKAVEALNQQISAKGEEINQYKEKHNIRIRGSNDNPASEDEKKPNTQGVLVDNKA